ncbi:5ca93f65-ccab-4271-9d54-0b9d5afaf9a6 [Thermothielavioides terrestris]|uniref:phosphatidylserine decarboxylase n=1 Tax=Thermothielavioides terrestris TaxID=2587410 RepID=A0A446BG28_9PEZI|nr:5ca93f65-ccab-4271-9d54-0b9d5afaf9a6 [Thermothielavioides terrestris]
MPFEPPKITDKKNAIWIEIAKPGFRDPRYLWSDYWRRFNTITIPLLDEDAYFADALTAAKEAQSRQHLEELLAKRFEARRKELEQTVRDIFYASFSPRTPFPSEAARTAASKDAHWGWMTFVRKTGKFEREQQPLLKKLRIILLFNPLTEWIDTTHAMRLYLHESALKQGKKEGQPESKKRIKQFIATYHINMDDFEPSDPDKYTNFEDFFTRRHKPGTRPTHAAEDASSAVVVADSRVVAYKSVAETTKLWIKGRDFSITNLVMDTDLGLRFREAAVASFRLSPQDYHRYHAPVAGRIRMFRSVPGDYYQVDAVALQSKVDILTRNRRQYVVIESEAFGDVLFVAIGATDVGSVEIHERFREPAAQVSKGDELGIFQFGGSSIIVAFEKGRIEFDQDLVELSKQKIQVAVEVGMSLGHAVGRN